jgi:hypothetical protein
LPEEQHEEEEKTRNIQRKIFEKKIEKDYS